MSTGDGGAPAATLASTNKAVRFLGRSRINTAPFAAALFLIALGFLCIFTQIGPVLFTAAGLVTALLAMVPTRIFLGNDGVRLAWIGSRFFAYGDVARVRQDGQDVVLDLLGGRTVLAPIGTKNLPGSAARRALLLQHLASARDGYARMRAANHDVLPRLALLGRDDESAYRAAPIEPDGLWRVVEDPALAVRYRVAAVNALTPSLDDVGKKRIADAADASASQETRASLQRAAMGFMRRS